MDSFPLVVLFGFLAVFLFFAFLIAAWHVFMHPFGAKVKKKLPEPAESPTPAPPPAGYRYIGKPPNGKQP